MVSSIRGPPAQGPPGPDAAGIATPRPRAPVRRFPDLRVDQGYTRRFLVFLDSHNKTTAVKVLPLRLTKNDTPNHHTAHTSHTPPHRPASAKRATATQRTPSASPERTRRSFLRLYLRPSPTLLHAVAGAKVLGPALGRELACLLEVVVDLERVENGLQP